MRYYFAHKTLPHAESFNANYIYLAYVFSASVAVGRSVHGPSLKAAFLTHLISSQHVLTHASSSLLGTVKSQIHALLCLKVTSEPDLFEH